MYPIGLNYLRIKVWKYRQLIKVNYKKVNGKLKYLRILTGIP